MKIYRRIFVKMMSMHLLLINFLIYIYFFNVFIIKRYNYILEGNIEMKEKSNT